MPLGLPLVSVFSSSCLYRAILYALGKDLKANNGNTLGKAVNVNFTVKAAEATDDGKDDAASGTNAIIKAVMELIRNILNFFAKLFKK